jgi:hypothetical protein
MKFEPGDIVYCKSWGKGEILKRKNEYSNSHPLLVLFYSIGETRSYTEGGIYNIGDFKEHDLVLMEKGKNNI